MRARLQKEGLADSLVQQLLERKALDRILESTHIEDVAAVAEDKPVETLDETVAQTPADEEETEPTAASAPVESPAEGS